MENKHADEAVAAIILNANRHRGETPTMRMLLAEIAELAYALEGEHEHSPDIELAQIGGIAINWIRHIYAARRKRIHPSITMPIQD